MEAGRQRSLGASLLRGSTACTMSLFTGPLVFASGPVLQDGVKIGIPVGSIPAGLLG